MPLFTYKAVDAQGRNVVGRAEAVNLFDLEQRLVRMGLDLVSGAPSSQRSRLIGGSRVSRQDLINFCFHLEQLATAGVAGVEGPEDPRGRGGKPRVFGRRARAVGNTEGGGEPARAPPGDPASF